jgi:hypothetical protein
MKKVPLLRLSLAVWCVTVAAAAGCGGRDKGAVADTDSGRWNIDELKAFDEFPVYWVGDEFDGLQLEQIIRVNHVRAAETIAPSENTVVLIYGSCDPAPSESCSPPLSVRVEPSCGRPRYTVGDDGVAYEIRGTLAAGSGRPVTLWTEDVAVSVFASQERTQNVIEQLLLVNSDAFPDLVVESGGSLPLFEETKCQVSP